MGLSPRRRGNLVPAARPLHPVGPIPAQAGEPSCGVRPCRSHQAYPRAGGGTRSPVLRCGRISGLSPRRRGNRVAVVERARGARPIPAQAGEPRSRRRCGRALRAYPRAGGGTESSMATKRKGRGLSPRRRGNLGEEGADMGSAGPIPAQAGEPSPRCSASRRPRAYPRAGGGTGMRPRSQVPATGLSPRRRGNPIDLPGGVVVSGPIPAQAGEPL